MVRYKRNHFAYNSSFRRLTSQMLIKLLMDICEFGKLSTFGWGVRKKRWHWDSLSILRFCYLSLESLCILRLLSTPICIPDDDTYLFVMAGITAHQHTISDKAPKPQLKVWSRRKIGVVWNTCWCKCELFVRMSSFMTMRMSLLPWPS